MKEYDGKGGHILDNFVLDPVVNLFPPIRDAAIHYLVNVLRCMGW
jgi:hypothetical protein